MAMNPRKYIGEDRRAQLAEKTVEKLLDEARIRDLFGSYEEVIKYAEKRPEMLKKLGMDAKQAWAENPIVVPD
jgi:hypothetical protein